VAGPDREGIHRRILHSLRRVLRRVEMSSRQLETDYGVTAPQLISLIEIVAAGSITQIDLSERVHLTPSTLVGVLDRLHVKGLIQRERDAEDRRRVNVSPTASGLKLVQKAPPPLQDTLLKGLGELSASELLTMAAALERLVDLLEAQEADPEAMLAPGPIPKPDG
jgi:DNA-binding MarR family transcriptional regulator